MNYSIGEVDNSIWWICDYINFLLQCSYGYRTQKTEYLYFLKKSGSKLDT